MTDKQEWNFTKMHRCDDPPEGRQNALAPVYTCQCGQRWWFNRFHWERTW